MHRCVRLENNSLIANIRTLFYGGMCIQMMFGSNSIDTRLTILCVTTKQRNIVACAILAHMHQIFSQRMRCIWKRMMALSVVHCKERSMERRASMSQSESVCGEETLMRERPQDVSSDEGI